MTNSDAGGAGDYRLNPDTSFPAWLANQSDRADDIGKLARGEGRGGLRVEERRELLHRAMAEWAATTWVCRPAQLPAS